MRAIALLLGLACMQALAQEVTETRELIGTLGGRTALLQLHATQRPDGSSRLTGEYLVLTTMQQRYLEGDRSKQLGVTFLKEGSTPILYGRPATATLQGTWSGGAFKGSRFGPGGQQRERFEFSENFPSMSGYSANVRCETAEGRYSSTLAYAIEAGRLKSIDWRSKAAPGEHPCTVAGLEQQPFEGGLRFASGRCNVTLRDLGEYVRVTAEDCSALCGSQGYLEPVLIDRRGACQLLRPQSR
ncbi:MAG TPA: hypothetical protein VMU46_15500 [Burkholderiales bacterium]|nr:hypothetical protein [Burkholderiales bacterium]